MVAHVHAHTFLGCSNSQLLNSSKLVQQVQITLCYGHRLQGSIHSSPPGLADQLDVCALVGSEA
jgi:hypothetical protein